MIQEAHPITNRVFKELLPQGVEFEGQQTSKAIFAYNSKKGSHPLGKKPQKASKAT